MARKLTDTVQLKLRFDERLRRRLEREAKKRDHSMNAEIVSRLEQSIEKAEADRQTASVEDVLRQNLRAMPKDQIGGALIAIAGLGGPLARRLSMAAIRTEQGKAAALEWLALEQKMEVIRAEQGEAAAQELLRREIDADLSRKAGTDHPGSGDIL